MWVAYIEIILYCVELSIKIREKGIELRYCVFNTEGKIDQSDYLVE